MIFTFVAIPLTSCFVTKSKNDEYSQRLIEDKLGIKKVIKWKHHNRVNILLTNNKRIQLAEGSNLVTHPISGTKMELVLKIDDKRNYSIQRIDTLKQENQITSHQWKILKNKSIWDYTTTDIDGQLIHYFVHTWHIGQGHGDFVDVDVVDTLGNTLREWGTTNSNKKRFRAGNRKSLP